LMPFQILFINMSKECEPYSNWNFVNFIWNYLIILKLRKYAIIAVPFETTKILYLKHHRAASEAWKTNLMCESCFEGHKEIVAPHMDNCALESLCRWNICLRQPPSLRLHKWYFISATVSNGLNWLWTLYDHYKYVADSKKVSLQKLVPITFPTLHCNFIINRNIRNKKFHKNYVIVTKQVPVRWSTSQLQHFDSLDDAVETLSCDKRRDDWWCWFCARPLFVSPKCMLSHSDKHKIFSFRNFLPWAANLMVLNQWWRPTDVYSQLSETLHG
jgi:hypothetical protein